MLRIDLWTLRRSSRQSLRGTIAPDAALWQGTGLRFASPVEVSATATMTPEGGVVVRGSWRARPIYECGRCLDAVEIACGHDLAVFFQSGESGSEADDPDLRMLDLRDPTLDLDEAIREEVLLELPRYHCPDEDNGLCVACGESVAQFAHASASAQKGTDPRWAALVTLQSESGRH